MSILFRNCKNFYQFFRVQYSFPFKFISDPHLLRSGMFFPDPAKSFGCDRIRIHNTEHKSSRPLCGTIGKSSATTLRSTYKFIGTGSAHGPDCRYVFVGTFYIWTPWFGSFQRKWRTQEGEKDAKFKFKAYIYSHLWIVFCHFLGPFYAFFAL